MTKAPSSPSTAGDFDGGRWLGLTAPSPLHLHGVWGRRADQVYAVGDFATVLEFDGSRWREIHCLGVDVSAVAVAGFGPHDLFVVGDEGLILRSDGTGFERLDGRTRDALYALWGYDADHVLAVGDFGAVLRWNGREWTGFSAGTEAFLYGVSGRALDDIVVVGLSGIAAHFDGRRWARRTTGTTADLLGVAPLDDTRWLAVGTRGTALIWDGAAWTEEETGTDASLRAGLGGSGRNGLCGRGRRRSAQAYGVAGSKAGWGEAAMKALRALLLSHEGWLIYRVIDYAKANNYSQYTPTLVSAWRESIVGLRDELAKALDEHPEPLPMPADHDYCADPYTAFAVGSARRHRARGVILALFHGLVKFFRLTFLDLVEQEKWPGPEAHRARELIARYFDRIELAISIDWASLGENEKIAEVQDKNRALANEKDKYLTIFESLEDPVFVFDERDGIENMNGAAWRLFGVENDPGALYYRPEGASAALEAVAARLDPSSLADGASLTLQTSAGECFFDVRRRDILDICDKYAGSVVILNDVTTHKHALRAAEEANRAKSAFLATMTHELRTPLNGVSSR